jgi:hypothetical protein
MADYTKSVIRILKDNNCRFVRHGKGDHDIWHSPVSGKNFTVDGAITKKPLANKVMRDAGINHRF